MALLKITFKTNTTNNMDMTINIYECVYRTEQGKELYTKTWYAPTWEHAYRMAEIYRTVTLHDAFDFILQRI